ncbi:APC family permease [Ligilactobacillus equi]|uniref:APC family amino acid-polyamine-organocation transporter n=1 Tax=Ligilactobacillus equi DPC 6820 TaxID=1392007 RepID=V7HVI0_9LACO|nr:APC family permease [Ligilactobacillus equi]ETA74244.1 APC family amino acid-polyamine-organocation transporter [Ligilactobacillus equi DPC 6820]
MKKNKISLFAAVMLALSSLIGSGWLFGAGEAARIAGPAAIFSWIIGAVIMIIIAINYVELGAMFPESGGMSRYAQYSHGSLLGFIAAWANWVSLVTIIPIEAVASVQYMSTWPWKWSKWTQSFMENGNISSHGLWVVMLFLLVFTLLNFWSVQLLTRFTNLISIFKLGLPALTIVMLIISGFHGENFTSQTQGFMPYGLKSVFEATAISGIIFSYDAFQTVINIGGEIKNPSKNILRGVIISLGISAIIYIFLQVAFIGAIDPATLAKRGWHGVNFASPFADVAIMLGLHWLAVLLYMDAFVSPFGTGVAFVATTGRALAAMTKNGNLPAWLGRLDRRYMTPRIAIATSFVVSAIMVSIFRNWSMLASIVAASTLIAYLTGPVTAAALRKMRPDFKRPVKLRGLNFIAPLSFVVTSLAIYWTMWPTTINVIGVIALGLPIYFYYQARYNQSNWGQILKGSGWMLAYLAFIALSSYLGDHTFGGIGLLKYPSDFGLIIAASLAFYYWALASRVDGPDLQHAQKVNRRVK